MVKGKGLVFAEDYLRMSWSNCGTYTAHVDLFSCTLRTNPVQNDMKKIESKNHEENGKASLRSTGYIFTRSQYFDVQTRRNSGGTTSKNG